MPPDTSQRPLVGVGVLVCRTSPSGTLEVLVGRRKGSHGGGEWALPGGHLEFGESFEECAAREVEEETAMQLGAVEFAYAVNSVFEGSRKHYVTVFCRAAAPAGAEPMNPEPHKCEGWEWVEYGQLEARCQPLFLPLAKLLQSPFRLQ